MLIINPAAGQGKAVKAERGEYPFYVTQSVGDGERFVYETCLKEPDTHFVVCGGDGTINEVVNGILKANAGSRALVSVLPLGTGNDFFKLQTEEKRTICCDAARYNDRYFINEINIGFDCGVVEKVAELKTKPLIAGSFAYICGVFSCLVKKQTLPMKLHAITTDGENIDVEDELLLCLVSNGQYYGGGFKAAPLADVSDGALDLLYVKDMSRTRFISMIGDYKKGTHINAQTGKVVDKYADIMFAYRCTDVNIEGMEKLCADGEIAPADSVSISVVPGAVNFVL